MTVAELIAELSEYGDDLPVFITAPGGEYLGPVKVMTDTVMEEGRPATCVTITTDVTQLT